MANKYAAIFLRPSSGTDGSDGTTIEVPLGNGRTPIPNLEVTRYAAGQIEPPEHGDILISVRHEWEIYLARALG